MTASNDRQDASPAAQLRFKIATRHAQEGIKIVDDSGQPVAIVLPRVENADLIASLFVSAPNLFYGVSRARGQLRAIVQKNLPPDDEGTLAVRRLLRELHEEVTAKK